MPSPKITRPGQAAGGGAGAALCRLGGEAGLRRVGTERPSPAGVEGTPVSCCAHVRGPAVSGGHGAACQETGLLAGHFPSGGETAMEPSVSDWDLPALPSGGHRVPATQGVASLSFCKPARERGFLTPHTSSGPFAEVALGEVGAPGGRACWKGTVLHPPSLS